MSAFEYQFRFLVEQVISSVGNNLSGHFIRHSSLDNSMSILFFKILNDLLLFECSSLNVISVVPK